MKNNIPSVSKHSAFAFKESNVSKVEGLPELLARFSKRIQVSYSGYSTVKTYRRAFTFTVPMELRVLFKMNERKLYNILFNSMWETLLSFPKTNAAACRSKPE